MGQYRLWLHYRETDQQLRGKLAALEQELRILQQQAHLSEHVAAASYSDNIIVQALLTHHTQQAEKLLAQVSDRLGTTPLPIYRPESTASSPEQAVTMSSGRSEPQNYAPSALQAWDDLPTLSAHDIQEPSVQANTPFRHPLLTNQQEHLSPEDISAFVGGQSLTTPQIQFPWWLRNVAQPEEHPEQVQNSVDQQSQRTNRLVERWFDRWGQHEQKVQEEEA